jgi:hypothetical protein
MIAEPLVSSDVQLSIEGVSGPEGQTIVEGLAGRAELDAGRVDLGGHQRPRSGRQTRWRHGLGGYIVWTFRATVVHSGSSARVEIEAANPDAKGLRFALGTDTRWDSDGAGRPLPAVGAAILHPALASGQSILFEVALPIRANSTAGRRSAEVRYSAVLNRDVFSRALRPVSGRQVPMGPVGRPAGLPLPPGPGVPR